MKDEQTDPRPLDQLVTKIDAPAADLPTAGPERHEFGKFKIPPDARVTSWDKFPGN